MAVTMTVELGLDGKYATRNGPRSRENVRSENVEEQPLDRHANCGESEESVENIESRRALLACYICSASVSIAFHRPKPYHFTPYMAESIDILESSHYAAPTDKCLAAWAKLQSVMDLSANSLRLNDQADVDAHTEDQIQLNLKNCSKQLHDWEKSLSPAIMNECLYINYRFLVCLLHESGLYADYDPRDFKPPYWISKLRTKRPEKATGRTTFTPNHISSVMACLSSAHSLLDTFLSMSVRSLQFSPAIVIVRAVYAIFLLFKIFFSASAIDGNLNQILDPTAIKLSFYLQQLRLKLVEVASLGCRLAAKFSSVTTKLQEWLRVEHPWDVHDAKMPQDLELIQSFRFISLGTESRTPPSDREKPGLPQIASFTNHEPLAGNSDPFELKYPEVGRSSMLNSGNLMPLEPSANSAHNDDSSAAIPSGDTILTSEPPPTDSGLPDWSGQSPTDSVPRLSLILADEFLDPNFDLNLDLGYNMDNGGGGDLATDVPLSADLPYPPSLNHTDHQVDGVDELQFPPDTGHRRGNAERV
ncbi:uncharacterized protein Z518_07857 [Rhinocladiella mackenziei CBS 650.93]|uniref:Transcription factor domain-containing protein n=1 Tax=Rhinocladiella mackenziei CBS 650.93 TaxID=1442369 RepID=A0A0D2GUD4_9EURO|nr:uncharacterized protein Z518_07857 [Rhinocladiella mackenziei CBS 650.93]KIX01918.1 hypothetical protein Z518_07857 [Rhinocladiella mackenziei CBS 650.93]